MKTRNNHKSRSLRIASHSVQVDLGEADVERGRV
jgi:hypothetical protein